MHVRLSLLSLGIALSLPALAPAQVLRSGPEFQVNQYTTNNQTYPSVARRPNGGFVVVWQSYQDGASSGIFARRFDANGMALSAEFQVNQYTTDYQSRPKVASDPSGNFVIVWHSYGGQGQDGNYAGVFGRRFDSNGTPLSNEFPVNSYTTSGQSDPSVAMDGAGNFVVTWSSFGQDGDDWGIFARRFDSTGTPLTGDFLVNTYTTGTQLDSKVATGSDGGSVVTWISYGQDGSGPGIFARPYDNTGAPAGPEFQVNTYTTGFQWSQLGPAVVSDSPGTFIVAWSSDGQDGDAYGAIGRRFDATGTPLTGEFQLNTYTTGNQFPFGIASAGGGDFVVVWEEYGGQDGSSAGSFGARFSSAGTALSPEFQINQYTTGLQYPTEVIQDSAGNIVIASVSSGQDGHGRGIFVQRFVAPRLIQGKKLLVKDPNGSEVARGTIILGREALSDALIAGDPTVNGATLRVIVNGTTPSDQTYVLDAAGWTALPVGFKYSGPTGGDGDPVKKALLKFGPSGTALLKVILKGNTGIQPLNVVPPNIGTAGGLILSINGGGATYCVGFGGAAGGSIGADAGNLFKLTNASGQDCPTP